MPPLRAQGSGWLIGPFGPNARPSGPLARTLRLRPVPALLAQGSGWLIFALWAQNAQPPGASPPSQSRRATFAGPGFRPAYWALRPKRSTSRGAVAPPSQSPRAAFSAARRSGWLIFALWAQNAQPPGASPPFAVAPCHLCWPRVPAGLFSPFGLNAQPSGASPPSPCASFAGPAFRPAYFSPFGLKTLGLQGLRPLRSRPVPPLPVRRSGWLIGPFGPNARPPGPLARTLRLRPVPALLAQGSGWLIFALWAQNAQPPGASPPSQSRRASFAGPGFRPGLFSPFGLKTLGLQGLRPLRSRPVPPLRAQGSGWLIFALWAQNAQPGRGFAPFAVAPCHLCGHGVPAGLISPFGLKTLSLQGLRPPSQSPRATFAGPGFRPAYFSPFGLKTLSLQELRPLRPVPASLAQRSGRLIFALRAQNARPAGASPPSQSPRATFAGPAFRLAYWAIRPKRSASRSAGADPSASPCASFAGPGFRLAYFRPLGSKRSAPRGFAPFAVAPCQLCWPRVPAGLFSPFGLKTLGLQGLRPLRSRPVPPLRAQGSGWLIFALWAQNAQPAGASPPSQSPRATFAGTAFRPAYFRPLGSKRSASRGFAPFAGCPRSLRGHLRAKMRSALLPLRMFFPRVRQSLRRVRGSPLWGSPLRRPSR